MPTGDVVVVVCVVGGMVWRGCARLQRESRGLVEDGRAMTTTTSDPHRRKSVRARDRAPPRSRH